MTERMIVRTLLLINDFVPRGKKMMKILIQPRQTGKTEGIARIMEHDTRAVCIVPTWRCQTLFVKKYPWTKGRTYTINEVISNPIDLRDKIVYIDDIGMCMEHVLPIHSSVRGYATHTN